MRYLKQRILYTYKHYICDMCKRLPARTGRVIGSLLGEFESGISLAINTHLVLQEYGVCIRDSKVGGSNDDLAGIIVQEPIRSILFF